MANLEVRSGDPISEGIRFEALRYLNDNCTTTELERLRLIAKSKKARNYLSNKWGMVKMFFGI